jgi:hypothetical protein
MSKYIFTAPLLPTPALLLLHLTFAHLCPLIIHHPTTSLLLSMGNCVQRRSSGGGGGRPAVQLQRRRRISEEVEVEAQGAAPPPSVVKVKMVLTKGELEWLVARLQAGDRRLEDVLEEMARKKRAAAGDAWRPSLESIVECPAETAAGADS